VRTLDEVSMWEQLGLAALLQKHWADNQVSCTVTFDPLREAKDIAHALDLFQYQLKGVSFLPRTPIEAYPQLPYQAISEAEYRAAVGGIRPLELSSRGGEEHAAPDNFCDSSACNKI
jgi:ribonucleoside-triphosphate reductase